MDGARDEFLARARFAFNQHARVGLGHQFDLLQHPHQRRAVPDDIAEVAGLHHLFTEIVPLQFQLMTELVDLLESAAVADGDRGVGCKSAQPVQRALVGMHSQKDRHHSHDASAKSQRVTDQCLRCARAWPIRGRSRTSLSVAISGNQHRFPGSYHLRQLASANRSGTR